MAPWSVFYGSFFAIYGLWVTFGPARLMQSSPHWAATSLALSSLVYFVALPSAQWSWKRFGFTYAIGFWALIAVVAYSLPLLDSSLLPFVLPLGSMAAAGSYGLAETYMIEALTAQGRAHEFGASRKWGSLGFLLSAGFGGFLLDRMHGISSLELLLALVAMGFGLSTLNLMRYERTHGVGANTLFPEVLNAPDAGELEPVTLAAMSGQREDQLNLSEKTTAPDRLGVAELCSSTPVAQWALMIALVGITFQRVAENQSTAWFGAMWMASGHSATQAGLLSAWAVLAEFFAMGASTRWLERAPLQRIMFWCCFISAIRWALTPSCSSMWCAASLQSIHALSFGVFYPASLIWIRSRWPDHFFKARFTMEGGQRALSSGYYFLAAGTLIPLAGYGPVFIGCGLCAAIGAMVWWLPALRESR
jgi:MFS_1 like family